MLLNSHWINTIATGFLQQVQRSPISSVASSMNVAPFSDFQCCTFYKCCTHRHCCAPTVAPFYSLAPFVSNYFVPCDDATRQFYISNNLATNVNTPCQLFTALLKSKFLQLQNMLPPANTFILLSWFSSLTSFKSTFAAPQLNCYRPICLLSTTVRRPSVDSIQLVYFCIIVSSFLHSLVKYYLVSINLCTPTISLFLFVVAYAFILLCLRRIEVVGVLYWKIADSGVNR